MRVLTRIADVFHIIQSRWRPYIDPLNREFLGHLERFGRFCRTHGRDQRTDHASTGADDTVNNTDLLLLTRERKTSAGDVKRMLLPPPFIFFIVRPISSLLRPYLWCLPLELIFSRRAVGSTSLSNATTDAALPWHCRLVVDCSWVRNNVACVPSACRY